MLWSAHLLQCQYDTGMPHLPVWWHTRVLPNHLFLFCPLQGDPGGVIGIVPLKGDRGFPGTPGLPVRCVYACSMCVFVNIHACVNGDIFHCNFHVSPSFSHTPRSLPGIKWTSWTYRTSRTSWLSGTQSELLLQWWTIYPPTESVINFTSHGILFILRHTNSIKQKSN